jgi:hypothetical protein
MTERNGEVVARMTSSEETAKYSQGRRPCPRREETAKPRMATVIESDVKVAADKVASL